MNVAIWITLLGGSRDEAPARFPRAPKVLFWGIWWGALAIAIYVFCGQSSKFIYIDF
jgi:hypothetical protein